MALTLDPITVNTDLAKNYLEKYNNFVVFPAPGKVWCFKKYPDDKIEYNAGNIPQPHDFEEGNTNTLAPSMARKLVEKIKQNELTFYQLEHLIRKTDKADFQNYFLLMCQYLQCDNDAWNLGFVKNFKILMNDNTPLYALGCVAAAVSCGVVTLTIVTTQKIAPICHLFTDLCSQIGCMVELVFVNEIKDYNTEENRCIVYAEDKACFGCTGVVTESADIDSALDVFIESSVTAPWKLQRIYVQESVYDEVKESLAARCERLVLPSCDQAFAAKGKVFACEALGAEGAALVPVEAYRTTKELCALLRQQPTLALSLWAADSEVSHEVALAATSTLVWINQCVTFHGPPASSLPAYEPLYSRSKNMLNDSDLQNLRSSWTNWIKLTKKERFEFIANALSDLSTGPKGSSVFDFYNNVLKARDESFVSIEDGRICFGVERPPVFEDIVYFEQDKPLKCVIAAINGNAIVYDAYEQSESMELLKLLVNVGAPVMQRNNNKSLDAVIAKDIFYRKLKVIRSNFGTIFAN